MLSISSLYGTRRTSSDTQTSLESVSSQPRDFSLSILPLLVPVAEFHLSRNGTEESHEKSLQPFAVLSLPALTPSTCSQIQVDTHSKCMQLPKILQRNICAITCPVLSFRVCLLPSTQVRTYLCKHPFLVAKRSHAASFMV